MPQNPRYQRPATCRGCSLDQIGFGFAPPVGPRDARLIVFGEALGYEEAIAGEPFYGAAGGMLSRLFIRAGIRREYVRIANIVSCRPPRDYLVGSAWEEHAIAQCRQYVEPVLADVPRDAVVVPLGATALSSILNLRGHEGIAVKDFHSTVTRSADDRYWIVPSFHPAFLLRGNMSLTEVVTQDLKLADRISQHGFTRSASELVVDPHPDWFRHWVGDYLAAVSADPEGQHLSLDTEFAEKAGGADESEIVLGDGSSPITRVNGARDGRVGWTVPYRQPYIGILEDLLRGVAAVRGWIWLWNKYADLDHLRRAGHTVDSSICVDAMWLWKYLQSDLPRGLGFVAPMASDFGAWKHWGKVKSREGEYAAADGLQTWRVSMWLLRAAIDQGIWEIFLSDWHERDVYVLRPAHEMGTPVNRAALEAFHIELQGKLANVLTRIKETTAKGVLKPKLGYAKLPLPKVPGWFRSCVKAKHQTSISQPTGRDLDVTFRCDDCARFETVTLVPPASIIGAPRRGGAEAKSAYMLEGVRLVEQTVEVEISVCETCAAKDVGAKHRCPAPKIVKPRSPRRSRRRDDTGVEQLDRHDLHERAGAQGVIPDSASAVESSTTERDAAVGGAALDAGRRPIARLRTQRVQRPRYFWQLPFNPDAPAQILAYLAQQGIDAPLDKKTKRATTNKKALDALKQQHREDPFFQLQMDWKAVQKVDATYAVGSLARLDADDRLHPEFTCKPSTFRDACQSPNLQNVVADKAGPEGLASGFRKCIQARDGVPSSAREDELAAWSERWPI